MLEILSFENKKLLWSLIVEYVLIVEFFDLIANVRVLYLVFSKVVAPSLKQVFIAIIKSYLTILLVTSTNFI